MAYISFQPSDYFNTVLWTGNSDSDDANQTITGVGFKPDLFWTKIRNAVDEHHLRDINLGNTTRLRPNDTAAANTSVCSVVPNSDGFVITGDDGLEFNKDGNNYVTWNWRGAGSTSSNTDGSVTSTVSANTTAGISIVKWTGTGSNATVGHGLSTAPRVIYAKNLGTTQNWFVFNKGMYDTDSTAYINLNTTDGKSQSASVWQSTAPTSSVFSTGTSLSAHDYVAYCFSDVKGYSKSGVYSGNGSADGTFVYTGFRPAWVMVKRYGANGFGWSMYDNKRDPDNVVEGVLNADTNAAEDTATDWLDLTSNGFKFRTTGGDVNASSDYIYHAFAEHPIVSSNDIPATAR